MTNCYQKDILLYKQQLNNVDIISFDIFDTLLIRPYQKPADLFVHMETLYNMPGFLQERTLAEHRARCKSGKEDISIDDIYNEIQDKYKPLKEKELEIEKQVISTHSVMKNFYDIALQKGKKIIAISDMYLPEVFLRNILEKNGYKNIDKIYVSSEIGKCKRSSNIYKYVCEDLKVLPQQILHIGDNIDSDFIKARDAGLKAQHIEPYINKFDKTLWGKRFIKLSKIHNSLDFSVLKSLVAQYIIFSENNDYWYTLAYILGGILSLGYVQFIDKRSQFFDIKQLLFISRDGYLLEKIYNLYAKNPVRTQYIYAPRILNLKCFCDFRNNREYFNTIIKLINEEGLELKYNHNEDDMFEFYNKNKQIFDAFAQKYRIEYEKYLNTLKIELTESALVDGVTNAFSSISFLKNFYFDNLKMGFFLFNHSISNKYIYNSFFSANNIQVTPFLVIIWELLLSSPEPPICDISNSKIIFYPPTKEIKQRQEICNIVEVATTDFFKEYSKYFKNYEIIMQSDLIFEIFKIFEKTLTTEDIISLKSIHCSQDVCNLSYTTIYENINCKKSFKPFLSWFIRRLKYYIKKTLKKIAWNIKRLLYKYK